MARAARLSGIDPNNTDDEFKEIEELKKRHAAGEQIGYMDRAKIVMESVVERVGFFGILACASVSLLVLFVVVSNIDNNAKP